jgi:hypothetical protein
LGFTNYPILGSKFRRLVINKDDFPLIPKNVTELVLGCSSKTEADEANLLFLDGLPHLEKMTFRYTRSASFPFLAGHLTHVKRLALEGIGLDLDPDQFERAAAAICRPGVDVSISYWSSDNSKNPHVHRELEFWRSKPGSVLRKTGWY